MDKAYIVANEQQEREVLEKLGHEGLVWTDDEKFPYVICENICVYKDKVEYLQNEEIVYDGRKEEQMSEKYVVSKEFMYGLEEWRKNKNLINELVWYTDIKSIPKVIKEWWAEDFADKKKTNNRLIAIIRWVNGEDVFEVEKPKKWVVRSIGLTEDNERYYVSIEKFMCLKRAINTLDLEFATRFDTKEEANSWANSHQEVIEVEG